VRSPRAVPWEVALPWAAIMVIPRTAAVPGRDDRGRGSACAKVVAARTSRGVGTSVTVKTPNAGGCSVAGRRRGGRPDAARTLPPKPSTPRRSGRAVSASAVHRKHRRTLRLRRRVVTQQKLFCRLPCATGRGAMNHPRRSLTNRRASAALRAVRRFAGCLIGNASGGSEARSAAARHVGRSTLPPACGAPDSNQTPSAERPHRRRPRDQAPRLRRSAVAGLTTHVS
jgi:hypothetical protein